MRFIVDFGEGLSSFFSEDLQNIYYKYLFKKKMIQRLKKHKYPRDIEFEFDSKRYWKIIARVNPMWHSFYAYCNGIKDVRYVPENIYYSKIEPFYNKKAFAKATDDKSYYTERFAHARHTELILRNISGMYFDDNFRIVDVSKAANICVQEGDFVVKPSIDGSGGNRITVVRSENELDANGIMSIFEKYKKDFVVERILTQHEVMEAFNPTSINTIRFITFMNKDGVYVLSAVLRMGGVDSFTDNFSTGGIACGISNTGRCKHVAYDQSYNRYEVHPNNRPFAEVLIPSFGKATDLVREQHTRFGHFRIISWDIVIAKDGSPVILEFNLTPQSIDFHQISNGPLFGDLTDEVLSEVTSKGQL
jgi:hypothetical protein